jgi:hypothetical protein
MSAATSAVPRTDRTRAGEVFQPAERFCFVSGTRIATPSGERPIEDLAAGDLVVVETEAERCHRPVSWIGKHRVNLSGDLHWDLLAPIRIRADAIAEGRPSRDVLVAPDHGLLLDGVLVPAWKLINDMTVVQDKGRHSVDYYQLELEKHGILLADGLPAESYFASDRRIRPADAGGANVQSSRIWEQERCAPRLTDPLISRQIWQRLASRAEECGFTPGQVTTQRDPNLRIIIDGREVKPILCVNNRYSFVLPKGTGRVVLASRAGRRTDAVRYMNDRRMLGVAVVSVTLRGRGDVIVFPADHLPAGSGWHEPEGAPSTPRRWTDGAGELRFEPLADARIMDVKLGGSMDYAIGKGCAATFG